MNYNPGDFEFKWQKIWKEQEVYRVSNDSDLPKYYILDMFPYPSGAGLHVGHPLGYIASDIYARYKRMKGFNVLHPMGFDAFGLPSEEYAIQTGIHPAISTKENMLRYREQLSKLGLSFDWSREVNTSDPSYFKWTQWIFTQLFEHYYDQSRDKALPISDLINEFEKNGNTQVEAANSYGEPFSSMDWQAYTRLRQADILMNYRLAFKKIGYVNWCEALGTVLANDQIKDGVSERGGHPVVQKAMSQWYLRITAYADRLLDDLPSLEWSDSLKTIQSNWIGRSYGSTIFFDIKDADHKIEVFTTRPDTIFGATYMVLSPEHDLVSELTSEEQKDAVKEYVDYVKGKSEIERMAEKVVTGIFLGSMAIHPLTKEEIPIWIGEYVLKDYGTGAIMAVPSDDDRDILFAEKYGLKIIPVVDKSNFPGASKKEKVGTMINSEFLNGMEVEEAIETTIQKIEELGIGSRQINYKIRDANFSRQRYWGEPFPIEFDQDGIANALPLDDLPLTLPDTDDFKPGTDGNSPLARIKEWTHLSNGHTRETDVMPAVAGSSWYFLRYMDPNNNDVFADKKSLDYWQDVDLYVGGSEHAVAHLLYARFWHKFLFDKGLVPTHEPFKKLINQGMIQGVIEYIYLLKEKESGYHKFICSRLAEMRGITELIRIPIHIDFVKDYNTDGAYLDHKSINQFINWRSEFKEAIFECTKGVFHLGKFDPADDATDSYMYTHSEVGKMSKRYYNVVNPDDVIDQYGTDCFRMYEMFLGPIKQSKPWDTNGIDGASKFLRKLWRLFINEEGHLSVSESDPPTEQLKILHTGIKNVTNDIERFAFNTCVSSLMIFVNDISKFDIQHKKILEPILRVISPFAPHLAEELWHKLGHSDSINLATYPSWDEKYLIENTTSYPISVNGKKRLVLELDNSLSKEQVEEEALNHPTIKKWLEGKEIKRVIVVPNRMVNVVV